MAICKREAEFMLNFASTDKARCLVLVVPIFNKVVGHLMPALCPAPSSFISNTWPSIIGVVQPTDKSPVEANTRCSNGLWWLGRNRAGHCPVRPSLSLSAPD